VPCLYPIRLICEAKNLRGGAGLPIVRNFVGAFKDIAENYFVEDGATFDEKILTKRYTDAGAIFSTQGFTDQAQDYAYAQGVFLVSYKDNPVLAPSLAASESLLNSINIDNAAKAISKFKTWIHAKTEDPHGASADDQEFQSTGPKEELSKYSESMNKITVSYLATASEIYPIHMLSENEIPWNLFVDTDETSCKIHYHGRSRNCLEIVPMGDERSSFYASIPGDVLVNYRDRLLEMKAKFFDHVDFPVLQNGKRRILRFNLDTEWIDGLKRRRRRNLE
jgi:hypothetical protein